MKNKIITTLAGMLLVFSATAQQDATFSQYFFNPLYYNPAYAGSREALSGTLVHRSQWIDMPGAPTTQALGLHTMLPNSNMAVGLQAYNDKAGPLRTTGFTGILAYHLKVSPLAKLSFGLAGSVNNLSLDNSAIRTENAGDPAFSGGTRTSWVPDANFGIYFYRKLFYAGVSVNHLMASRFRLEDGPNSARYARHYYLTSGIVVPLNANLSVRPSILLKYVDHVPFTLDMNGALIFYNRFFLGVGLRTGKRVGAPGADNVLIESLEYDFKNGLRIGYAYDYYLNRGGSFNSGTHEIMLGWDLNLTKTRVSSPRFF